MPGNLQSIPASVIESWPTPNYHAKGRTWIVPYTCVLQGIMTVMVGTRLALRARQQAGQLGLDDLLLAPAFLAATMLSALVIIATEKYGMNRHIYDVQFDLFVNAALTAWLSELAFLVSTCCTKVSVLLFYRRLTQGTISKRWKYATIGAIIFTVAYCVTFVIVLLVNCRPTEAYWKAYSPTYKTKYVCTDTTVLNPVSGALSMLSDLYSVVLPMSMLRHFDAPKRYEAYLHHEKLLL
jgi:hypothetical protein